MPDLNRLIRLGLHTRRLFCRLARAVAKKVFQNFQIEYYRTMALGLKFSNSQNFGPSATYEV
jgi:hypothetical protein